MSRRLLIVDDETRLATVLAAALGDIGYLTETAASGEEAVRALEAGSFDLVLTDLKMPGMDGRALLHVVRTRWPDVPVILITAFAAVRDAVDLIKEGAFDYIAKPFEVDDVAATVARALRLTDVVRDNERLRSELEGRYSFTNLIGSSSAFRTVIERVTEVCETRATVLLSGESGTGKEAVARAIHYNSPRRKKPFVAVNCAAIPESLIESELFGHVRGAFTGAHSNRAGKFAAADGGTLFLDEVGDMPLPVQAKILRVLQERAFEAVGSDETQKVDVRIIAASLKDLRKAVEDGRFRDDLFYRLNVFPITLPPLRERKDDIGALSTHILSQASDSLGKRVTGFTPGALQIIAEHGWPGNIRELQNCIERAVIVSKTQTIDVQDLSRDLFLTPARANPGDKYVPADLDAELGRLERTFILEALRRTDGVQVRAAEMLGIAERSLWHRIKKLNIKFSRRAGE